MFEATLRWATSAVGGATGLAVGGAVHPTRSARSAAAHISVHADEFIAAGASYPLYALGVIRRVLVVLLVGSCGAPPPLSPPQATEQGVMRAHFIDVGQGDATLLEFPCGAVLVDTGGEQNAELDSDALLVAYLDRFFAGRPDLRSTLSALVLSHPHADHTHGVGAVLERYAVKAFVDDGLTTGSGRAGVAAVRAFAAAHPGTRLREVSNDDIGPEGMTDDVIDPVRCEGVDPHLTALWGRVPVDPGWKSDAHGRSSFENANNHSVVLRVDFGRASFLLTGDLEVAAQEAMVAKYGRGRMLDVDVLKVAHHGSYNGTTEALLAASTPEVAVIPMGPSERRHAFTAWKFGHPRRVAVERLARAVRRRRPPLDVEVADGVSAFSALRLDAAVYATGWDGTVIVEANANGELAVRTSRGKLND